ncbi:unnamed protein product, partial [Ixodes hexagonus]
PKGGSGVPDGTTSPPLDAAQMLNKVRQADGVHYRLPVTPDDFLIPGCMTVGTEIYVFGLLSPTADKVEFLLRPMKTRERVALSALATVTPETKVTLRSYVQKTYTDQTSGEVELSPSDSVVFRIKAYQGGVAKVTYLISSSASPKTSGENPESPRARGAIMMETSCTVASLTFVGCVHVNTDSQVSVVFFTDRNVSITTVEITDSRQDSASINLDMKSFFLLKAKSMLSETEIDRNVLFLVVSTVFKLYLFSLSPSKLDKKKFINNYDGKNNHTYYSAFREKRLTDVANQEARSVNVIRPERLAPRSAAIHQTDAPASKPIKMEVNQCYYIQGTPPLHAKTFKIAFAKGDSDAAEALLVIESIISESKVHVFDGAPGNKGAGSPADIKIGRLFSCRIDVGADSYKARVWVNTLVSDVNVDAYEVKHRLPISEAAFLNVTGQIKNVSALKAIEEAA